MNCRYVEVCLLIHQYVLLGKKRQFPLTFTRKKKKKKKKSYAPSYFLPSFFFLFTHPLESFHFTLINTHIYFNTTSKCYSCIQLVIVRYFTQKILRKKLDFQHKNYIENRNEIHDYTMNFLCHRKHDMQSCFLPVIYCDMI